MTKTKPAVLLLLPGFFALFLSSRGIASGETSGSAMDTGAIEHLRIKGTGSVLNRENRA
jgi:hypothetical protein